MIGAPRKALAEASNPEASCLGGISPGVLSLSPSPFLDGKLSSMLSHPCHIKLHVCCFLTCNHRHVVERVSEAKIQSTAGDKPDNTERSIHPNEVWVLRNRRKRDTYRSCDANCEPKQGRDERAQTLRVTLLASFIADGNFDGTHTSWVPWYMPVPTQ